ncbi:MAG: hypothetical protein RJA99_4625 [Pseudomonadota bacterium]|jgi:hypothetical protein
MKTRSLMLVPVAALTFLAGCSTQQGQGSGGSMMGGSGGGMAMGGGNSAQMCEMYRQMMAGKSPAEQQSAMEAHMRSMHGSNVTPEQARMHREMMEKNCAGMSTR